MKKKCNYTEICLTNIVNSCIGEVVGASSFSVGYGASTLKKVASIKMLHQAYDVQNVVSYPLKRRVSLSQLVFFLFDSGKVLLNLLL